MTSSLSIGAVQGVRTPVVARLPVRKLIFATASLFALMAGCEKPREKTINELYREENELPALFITAKTQQRIVAPGSQGVFVDKNTGELAWSAFVCNNPDCPARGKSDEAFLFIIPDPAVIANPDGTVGYDRSRVVVDQQLGYCPECLKLRNMGNESMEERTKYARFVKPYVLPETHKRRQELAQARQQRKAQLEERMKRPLQK
jgi:hypothetical protein